MSAPTVFPLQPVRRAESPFSSLLHTTRFQGRAKRGRGKAVSWPPEDQICQIRFFLSNDAPSALGSAQVVYQWNQLRSLPMQSGCMLGALDIPPGFHGSIAKRARVAVDVSMTVGVQWFSPQKFVQERDWLVAEGNESEEVGLQKERELRVLEAFYPRLTTIPDSPAEPADLGTYLDDNLVPEIPLVPIEDEEESSEGPEYVAKEEVGTDMAVAEQGKLNDAQKPQLPTSGCVPHSHDTSVHVRQQSISEADPKVAAAAAAAACLAMQKLGANGPVDQELLVEILRNPALLKNLSFLSASRKDLAGPVQGNEVGIIGHHSDGNSHNINQHAGCFNKASFNTGMPSPVSVLSDWTQEHSTKSLSRTPSNLRDTNDTPSAKNASSSMNTSLPFRHSHGAHPSREIAMCTESVSAPLHGAHAMKASHASNNASAQTASSVHTDRASGMATFLAPFPSQNVINPNPSGLGRIQPVQVLNGVAPPIGVMRDSSACRSTFSDAMSRGVRTENPSLGSMSKTGPKSARLCIYFNTPRGCRNGGNCAFLHESLSHELNSITQ